MQAGSELYNDFSAGVLGPEMHGRLDLEIYKKGLEDSDNMLGMRQGGITKAPGTLYLGECESQANAPLLIDFEMDEDDAALLEINGTKIVIWMDDEVHQTLSSADTAWTDLTKIRTVRYRTDLYIAADGVALRKLSVSGTTFSIAAVVITNGTALEDLAAPTTPAAIAIHEARFIMLKGQTVWGSVVGDFDNFTGGVDPADAWTFGFGGPRVAEGMWLEARGDLIVGTMGAEYRISGGGGGITPLNVMVSLQTTWGSHSKVAGKIVTDTIVFVQKGGRLVREYQYEDQRQAYLSRELTLFSQRVMGTGIRDMAVVWNPDPGIIFITNEGKAVYMLYDKNLNLLGFFPLSTTGTYESVAAIPALAGEAEDSVYFAVNRESGRFIEKMAQRHYDELKEGVFVHSGIVWDGGAAKTITAITNASPAVVTVTAHGLSTGDFVRIKSCGGMIEVNENVYYITKLTDDTFELQYRSGTGDVDSTDWGVYTSGGLSEEVTNTVTVAHLDGEDVVARIDGAPVPAVTVDTYEALFDRWGNYIVVGLPYTAYAKTLRIGFGDMKKIGSIIIRFLETVGCQIGPDDTRLKEIIWYSYGDELSDPPPMFTGDKKESFPGVYDRKGQVYFQSDYPLPLTILGLYPEYVTYQEV